jgi:hypothetical protein
MLPTRARRRGATQERVGFEPTDDSSPSAVFKTAALNRSATSPRCEPISLHRFLVSDRAHSPPGRRFLTRLTRRTTIGRPAVRRNAAGSISVGATKKSIKHVQQETRFYGRARSSSAVIPAAFRIAPSVGVLRSPACIGTLTMRPSTCLKNACDPFCLKARASQSEGRRPSGDL